MDRVLYVNFRLRRAMEDRRASIEAYYNALRANAPLQVLAELQAWCLDTDARLSQEVSEAV